MHKKNNLVVLACGTFDLFHKGHLHYLKKASDLGDLYVIVARDSNVLKIKGALPEEDENIRLSKISELKFVKKAVLGDKNDFFKNVSEIDPDILAMGYDQNLPLPIQTLQCVLPDLKIVRIKPYKPHKYKTSLLKKIHSTPQF